MTLGLLAIFGSMRRVPTAILALHHPQVIDAFDTLCLHTLG